MRCGAPDVEQATFRLSISLLCRLTIGGSRAGSSAPPARAQCPRPTKRPRSIIGGGERGSGRRGSDMTFKKLSVAPKTPQADVPSPFLFTDGQTWASPGRHPQAGIRRYQQVDQTTGASGLFNGRQRRRIGDGKRTGSQSAQIAQVGNCAQCLPQRVGQAAYIRAGGTAYPEKDFIRRRKGKQLDLVKRNRPRRYIHRLTAPGFAMQAFTPLLQCRVNRWLLCAIWPRNAARASSTSTSVRGGIELCSTVRPTASYVSVARPNVTRASYVLSCP